MHIEDYLFVTCNMMKERVGSENAILLPQTNERMSQFQQQPSFIQFKDWDKALKQFFIDMGLTQTLRGFENDILVLNPEWEASRVPAAMAKFIRSLVVGIFSLLFPVGMMTGSHSAAVVDEHVP